MRLGVLPRTLVPCSRFATARSFFEDAAERSPTRWRCMARAAYRYCPSFFRPLFRLPPSCEAGRCPCLSISFHEPSRSIRKGKAQRSTPHVRSHAYAPTRAMAFRPLGSVGSSG